MKHSASHVKTAQDPPFPKIIGILSKHQTANLQSYPFIPLQLITLLYPTDPKIKFSFAKKQLMLKLFNPDFQSINFTVKNKQLSINFIRVMESIYWKVIIMKQLLQKERRLLSPQNITIEQPNYSYAMFNHMDHCHTHNKLK